MEIFTSTTDELFVEPLRKKLNYAPIWQKCSIKLTILEMLAKWRSSEFEITPMRNSLLLAFFSFTFSV
jgi:hypothetical protein